MPYKWTDAHRLASFAGDESLLAFELAGPAQSNASRPFCVQGMASAVPENPQEKQGFSR
jgi:hypothetical protein